MNTERPSDVVVPEDMEHVGWINPKNGYLFQCQGQGFEPVFRAIPKWEPDPEAVDALRRAASGPRLFFSRPEGLSVRTPVFPYNLLCLLHDEGWHLTRSDPNGTPAADDRLRAEISRRSHAEAEVRRLRDGIKGVLRAQVPILRMWWTDRLAALIDQDGDQ